ncbi:MAG: isocitrate/isopropylmalate family dehydrogenase [Candidatus Nitrospinota bacterium M3_3B_026]
MSDQKIPFEGAYDPTSALLTLLEKEGVRVTKAITGRGSWEPVDLSKKRPLKIGFAPGDGIGPIVAVASQSILKQLLGSEVESGQIEIVDIPDLTIEKRLELDVTAPETSIKVIDSCDVVLKMPLETPDSSKYPNVSSANVWMRQHMDLFACMRRIKNDEHKLDFTIFRCNLGTPYQDAKSAGVMQMNGKDEYAMCFWPQARVDIERLTHLACLHAAGAGSNFVVLNFKDNVIKPDAAALNWAKEYIDANFPDIDYLSVKPDDFSYTITQPDKLASMKGEKTGENRPFTTMVCNNIVGDMAGDEGGMYVGGIGGVGSANVSFSQGMFEAGGGTGTRMMQEGRGKYANPVSVIKALAEMLGFIGYPDHQVNILNAVDALNAAGKAPDGGRNKVTCEEAADFIIEQLTSKAGN